DVSNVIDLGNPDYSYYKHYYGSHYAGGTNAPKNGTHRTDVVAGQSGLHQTGYGFEETTSERITPQFLHHLITKFNEAVGMQERVEKISAILRSKGEFRPTMSEGGTKEANNGSRRKDDVNIKDERQQPNKGFREYGSKTVSSEFLNRLIAAFSEQVGPMADVILRDEAAGLGESFESFSTNRLQELVDNISMEIVNDSLKEE